MPHHVRPVVGNVDPNERKDEPERHQRISSPVQSGLQKRIKAAGRLQRVFQPRMRGQDPLPGADYGGLGRAHRRARLVNLAIGGILAQALPHVVAPKQPVRQFLLSHGLVQRNEIFGGRGPGVPFDILIAF